MRPNRKVLIIGALVLVVVVAAGWLWFSQSHHAANPKAVTASPSATVDRSLSADLDQIKRKLETYDPKVQAEVLVPSVRDLALRSGQRMLNPGQHITFNMATLHVVDDYAAIESTVGASTFIVRLEKIDGHWYVLSTQVKE